MEFVFGQPTLETLLRQYVYVVPRFQRSYEWTEIEWDDLWTDIVSTLGQSTPHFMGALVVSKSFNDDSAPKFPPGTSVRFVIDGQQRLVTLSILLARLHRRLEAAGLVAAELQTEVLRWIMVRDPLLPQQQVAPRVVLNDDNARDVFVSIVDPAPPPPPGKKTGRPPGAHTRMRKAADYFDRELANYLDGAQSDMLGRLRALVFGLGRRLQFVDIEVDSEADAYTIFESLNARGIDLTVADLVKNLLLGRAKRLSDQLTGMGFVNSVDRDTEEAWTETVFAIREGFSERLPGYLRHYWIARHEFVREDSLYKRISELVRGQTNTGPNRPPSEAASALTRFARDVEASARNYVWLWSAEGAGPYETHPRLERARLRMDGIRAFNAVQVLPVLLAAANRPVSLERFERLCLAAETAIVRRSLAEQPANKVERESGEMCRLLREEADEGLAVGRVTQTLLALAADNQEPDPLLTKTLSSEKAKHILLSLENYLRSTQNKELTLLDPTKVDVEHILPQSPKEDAWPLAAWGDSDIRKAMLNRLGNFALLAKTANRAVGNAPFSCGHVSGTVKCCKRHTYENSELLLTREIADEKTWGPTQIDERQRRLAELGETVWPRKVSPGPSIPD